MKRERLGVAESVNAIKDGKIDAFFWVGGLPTAAVTDLANTPGTKIKMIDHADAVAAMNKKYGNLYVEDAIPKATYQGMDADNKQATVMNILVAHESMDDKTAYNIVKTIFDKRDDLIAVHKEAANFKLENQKAGRLADPVPSGRGEVLRRKRHQAQLKRRAAGRSATAASRSATRRCTRPRSSSRPKKARPTSSRAGSTSFVVGVAFVMSAFHLYTAYAIVPTQTLRPVHVAFVLFLCFLVFPVAKRFRHRVMWWDWIAAALAIAVVGLPDPGGDDITDRNTSPEPLGHRVRHRADRAGARGDAAHQRLDHAGRSPAPSSPTRCSAPTCRRRGRTRATRSAAWSA